MWVEMQSGDLINLDNGVEVALTPPSFHKRKWAVILNRKNIARCLAEYGEEKTARAVMESFKEKIRRTGGKIFKFKEEAEENGVTN